MEDGLDIVAIGVQDKSGVVPRVVETRAGRAVLLGARMHLMVQRCDRAEELQQEAVHHLIMTTEELHRADAQVARAVGYRSHSAFSRAWRQRYGGPPTSTVGD